MKLYSSLKTKKNRDKDCKIVRRKGRIFVIFIIPFFLSTVKHAFYMPDGKDREKSLIHCDLARHQARSHGCPGFCLVSRLFKRIPKGFGKKPRFSVLFAFTRRNKRDRLKRGACQSFIEQPAPLNIPSFP